MKAPRTANETDKDGTVHKQKLQTQGNARKSEVKVVKVALSKRQADPAKPVPNAK